MFDDDKNGLEEEVQFTNVKSDIFDGDTTGFEKDNEYVTSLLADKEKEVIALKQAESLRLKEDEYWKKLLEIKKIKNVR
ncbi:hypothetical protein Q3G72_005526 [Acer saccharum]|nr:hypothetical protein Q3G72_005526 [Acer saccharum]